MLFNLSYPAEAQNETKRYNVFKITCHSETIISLYAGYFDLDLIGY